MTLLNLKSSVIITRRNVTTFANVMRKKKDDKVKADDKKGNKNAFLIELSPVKLCTVKLFVNSCANTVEKFLTADLKDVEGQRRSSTC